MNLCGMNITRHPGGTMILGLIIPGLFIQGRTHRIAAKYGDAAMKNRRHIIFLFFATVVLAACATAPKFDTNGIDLSISPQQAVAETEALQGVQVLGGGVIISSANLKEVTQFEIRAYPRASNQRPDTDKAPLGRFLARQEGYLEASDYSQGRLITISGTLQDKRSGSIGETEYTYPVLKINQLHLWKKRGDAIEPQFHIGIGVMFNN